MWWVDGGCLDQTMYHCFEFLKLKRRPLQLIAFLFIRYVDTCGQAIHKSLTVIHDSSEPYVADCAIVAKDNGGYKLFECEESLFQSCSVCIPGSMFSLFRIISSELAPLFHQVTTSATLNSVVGFDWNSALEQSLQRVWCVASLWFCVAPSKQRSSSLGSAKSKKMLWMALATCTGMAFL